MSILRHTAHVLLAAPFVIDGIDAVRDPDTHAEKVKDAWQTVEKWGAPAISLRQLRVASRLTGALSAGLGVAYVIGPNKRLTAAALAAFTVPLAAVNLPMAVSGSKHERAHASKEILRYGVLLGGLTLGFLDRNGKPSRAWKRHFQAEQRQAVAAAKASVTHAV